MDTRSESYVYEDPNKIPKWLVRIPADSTHPEPFIFDPVTTDGQTLLDSLQQYGLQYKWVADPNNAEGYVHPDSTATDVSYSYLSAGNDLGQTFRNSAYWIGKLDLTSQANPIHQLKAGAELRLHELSLDTYTLQGAKVPGREETLVPFQPVVPDPSNLYRDKYTRKPKELSAYVQDKIELKNIILNLGLRFDYFDANSVVPTDPQDINIYAPFLNKNIYKNYVEPPTKLSTREMEDYVKQFAPYTPDERRAFMHKKVDPKTQISPRLGIAYPITDKGVIHFSYGHFFQIPEFQYLYDEPDFKLNTGGSQSQIGNADLNPQRTTKYELGLKQEVMKDLGIEITVFYSDIRDLVQASPLIPTYRDVVKYSIYENRDYANVRGITFRAEKRYTSNFFAEVDYSYQVAEGSYSNPNDAFSAIQNEQEPRKNLIPLNWDQRHTLNAQLIYRLNSWTASLIGKYRTGLPYTPSFAVGERVGGTTLSALPDNSARNPIIASLDMYLTKSFRFGRTEFTLFLYAYNLTDNRAATSVFGDTGSTAYTTNPKEELITVNSLRIGTYEDLYSRPDWYIAPRQLQAGLQIGF